MEIVSLKNSHVKYWCDLKEKKFRDQEKKFLVEGNHLINEARRLGLIVETISTTSTDADYLVNESIMKKISDQKSISSEAAVVKFKDEKDIVGNVLILDNIQDPGNLGTIIRSAVAFNMPNIVLSLDSVDLYNSKVIRATEGMIFYPNIIRKNIVTCIKDLKIKGYEIIGTDVNKGIDIKSINKNKVAIIIGNEGNGISSSVKELCDNFINIKMNSSCESLNAGVSASIIMYEVNNG